MSVLMASEVLTELRTWPRFGSKLQLDELFDRLWASVRSVIAHIYIELVVQAYLVDNRVDNQGSNYGVRLW